MDVSNTNPTPPPSYQSDFNQSVELFEKSFKNMTSSQNPEQKLIYQDVMKKSLQVMQDSAHAMFNKHLVELKNNLSSDLNSYLTAPSSENQEKVLDDIQQIKRNED